MMEGAIVYFMINLNQLKKLTIQNLMVTPTANFYTILMIINSEVFQITKAILSNDCYAYVKL